MDDTIHFEMFLRDHPELKPVEDCEYKRVLEWANSKKYIRFKQFLEKMFYTDEQLDAAIMWAEKEEVLF